MRTIFLSFTIAESSVSDYFSELSNRLAAEFQVIIITDGKKVRPEGISSKIKIFKWPSKRPTNWSDLRFLIQMVKRYRPEIMLSVFGSVNMFLIVGFLLGVKTRIAWSRTISAQFASKKSLQMRKKYVYKLATHIFANSKATKLDLVQNFGVPEIKIEVVYNAVKQPLDRTNNIIKNKIVYVGRMHPSKGVLTLLQAMPLVISKFPDVNLVLVGGELEGKEIKDLKAKAEVLEIGKSISFLGNRPKICVLEEFSEAYCTVVPSLVEAFGFVVIESFSVKTPVVGSNTSGIAEIVRDGKDGFLFEPGNSEDLAFNLIKLLGNPELRKNFSEGCYQRFLEEFEIKKSTQKLVLKISDLASV
ncbi:glycosyltransferase family 4 protein [Antarcticibacterium arcticum]|uniref:Glycosyltransferase family 4 protein n=1 Tax=Antarcticibacterium arcticum TaxID=2585771 RepID=A0A5B8YIY9_9FLAO|nr:glycosyltransferase family 4 protein [Antarcticibacterium arcticum]QED37744.1 glycosyltransferase family 4 protein [Antarcticibacterium arcticum]